MRSTTLSVSILFIIFGCISAQYWTPCGTNSDLFTISKFAVDPSPPVVGQNATVYIAGQLTETVTGGNATLIANYYLNGWHALPSFVFDTCSIDGSDCPIQPGAITRSGTFFIPSYSPQGEYKGQLVVVDQNNQTLTCVNYDITLGSNTKISIV
eukprot:TRINITY_DN11927_c0_g1_i1.p1 TRINITY_DN11927_c0_g1~~TRINITY_DN11927_c0_g1_i1.p1  ORF type:complete len:154 (-),score=18.81 TRINITY_DN11927_c0_g1_i1:79-540(-)